MLGLLLGKPTIKEIRACLMFLGFLHDLFVWISPAYLCCHTLLAHHTGNTLVVVAIPLALERHGHATVAVCADILRAHGFNSGDKSAVRRIPLSTYWQSAFPCVVSAP